MPCYLFFLACWRSSSVGFVLKNTDEMSDHSNFWLISFLSPFDKVVVVLITSLTSQTFLSDKQYRFHLLRAIPDALPITPEKTMKLQIKMVKYELNVFEISKAFNRVWHDCILLKVKKNTIPNPVKWYFWVNYWSVSVFLIKYRNESSLECLYF